jgi:hypothetical protein
MEDQKYDLLMQKEMANEIESTEPKFVVVVNIKRSWLMRQGAKRYIFDWLDNFLAEYYVLVGVIDIMYQNKTIYKWDNDARNYQIKSNSHLLVFRKRMVRGLATDQTYSRDLVP